VSPRTSILPSWLLSPFGSARVPLQLLAATCASLLGAYAVVNEGDFRVVLGVVGVIAFAAVGLARPALFLGLLLLVRPLLDKIGQKHVGGLNASGALGLFVVLTLAGVILTSKGSYKPHATGAFGIVLGLSALGLLPAYIYYSGTIGAKPVSELVRVAAMLGVYVLAAQLFDTPKKLTTLFTIVALSGVVPAILGIIEWTHQGKAGGLDIVRIGGPFDGPNPFGMFLASTALVMIGLPRRVLPSWVRFVSLGLMLAALVGTYSRAGWALFLVGFMLLMWRRKPWAVGLGVVAVVSLIMLVPTIHDRVLPPNKTTGSGVATPESFQFRLNNWSTLLKKWENRPVTGYGIDTTSTVNPRKTYDQNTGSFGGGFAAHNSVVKLLVEGGVVLLVAWLALIAIVTKRTRTLSRRRWPFQWQARTVFVLWVASIVVGLSTDDPLAASAMIYGVFALTGALEGTYERLPRTAETAPASASAPVATRAP
jgi:O-antigen ligase